MDTTLEGRRVLVVGASSGIGAAFAKAVAAAGGQVSVSARRSDRLEQLVAEMGTGHAVPGDATNPDDARTVAAAAAEAMGGLDLMLYVAGYGVLQPLVETDPETWVDVFRVNVVGANLAAAAALDHLDQDGIAAAEVAVGLALIVALYRKRQTTDVTDLTSMKL